MWKVFLSLDNAFGSVIAYIQTEREREREREGFNLHLLPFLSLEIERNKSTSWKKVE